MKQCPQCARTYADETISFCLADGQLLSPSYDSAATLPLTPARATDGAATLILPVALTPERAQKIIRRNWIAGAVTVPIGFIGSLIAFSTQPNGDKPPLAVLVGIAAVAGLVYAYLVWSAFWGFPKVWRWWRNFARKIFKFVTSREFQGAVLVLAIILGLCLLGPALAAAFLYFYSLFWFGLAYSIFGGGIYQFLKARKIAKSDVVSES
jgi:hypothetical protein